MTGNRANRLRRPLALAAFLVLTACGVSSSTTPIFVEGIIGPGGGTLEAQGIKVVVPPGAFDEEIVCAIVPGPDDLPVDPGAGPITLLPGCKCIGPRGEPLEVPGTLRYCYELSILPPDTSETDLVLLEFDDALGFLVVVGDATQDLVNHCFEDPSYDELGYVTIGLRTGPAAPPPLFVFFDGGLVAPSAIAPQGRVGGGLVLAEAVVGGTSTPVPLTSDAVQYLPSFDAERVLFTREPDGASLHTVETASPAVQHDLLGLSEFDSSQPMFGWFGPQDDVYYADFDFSQQVPSVFFASRDRDAVAGPTVHQSRTGSFIQLIDVRVSPDRTKVLLRWKDTVVVSVPFDVSIIDVLDATTGNVIAADIPAYVDPQAPQHRTPRWMPDSSGIYFVEPSGTSVTRLDVDGTNPTTLYTLPVAGTLQAFVLVPLLPAESGQRCAYVRRESALSELGLFPGPDYYETDLLAGGDLTSANMGFGFPADDITEFEAAFPDAGRAAPGDGRVLMYRQPPKQPVVTHVFDVDSSTLVADLPISVGRLDLSREVGSEGDALLWIETFDQNHPEFPTPGLYRMDSTFSLASIENVTPSGTVVAGPPRWLRSWRASPGYQPFTDFAIVR